MKEIILVLIIIPTLAWSQYQNDTTVKLEYYETVVVDVKLSQIISYDTSSCYTEDYSETIYALIRGKIKDLIYCEKAPPFPLDIDEVYQIDSFIFSLESLTEISFDSIVRFRAELLLSPNMLLATKVVDDLDSFSRNKGDAYVVNRYCENYKRKCLFKRTLEREVFFNMED